MKIRIKRFDTSIPLPEYKTDLAAGFDLAAREEHTIEPGAVGYVPLNVAIEVPATHWVLVAARSSLHKRGLIMANGIGVGDADFAGDTDEYRAILMNTSDQAVTIEKGERIVQALILAREQVTIEEAEHLGNPDRGGIGSTGRR